MRREYSGTNAVSLKAQLVYKITRLFDKIPDAAAINYPNRINYPNSDLKHTDGLAAPRVDERDFIVLADLLPPLKTGILFPVLSRGVL